MLNCSSSKGDTYLLLENLNVLLFSLAYIGNMTLAIKPLLGMGWDSERY